MTLSHPELLAEARRVLASFEIEQLRDRGLIPLGGEYFPAIFYPPIPFCPPGSDEDLFRAPRAAAERPLSFYVHVPFCPGKCVYCHWTVTAGASLREMEAYLATVDQELAIYQTRFGGAIASPRSILIGGGTPTMLPARLIDALFAILRRRLDLSQCAQIICEAEPATVLGEDGFAKLESLRANGVRRLSFGVQTFDDATLRAMGRHHTSLDAVRAVEAARRAGFPTISLDLLYGFPGHSLDAWLGTLGTALALDVDACQIYRLRIVPHGDKEGAIRTLHARAPASFPAWSEVLLMKEASILYCRERGFCETSRRVFSRGSRHDSAYLKDHNDRLADVLGVGISSWSSIQGHLSINTSRSMAAYYAPLSQGRLPIDRCMARSAEDTCRWALVLPLKHHGVVKDYYQAVTGRNATAVFGKKIRALKEFGLLEETDSTIRLTPKGRFFADEVVLQFYDPQFLPFPKASYADGVLSPHNDNRVDGGEG